MKYIVALFICCLALSEISCKKDNRSPIAQLPPITQQGKNTFGCLIDGSAWLPQGGYPLGSINPNVSYDPTYNNGAITISATCVTSRGRLEMRISGYNIDKAGVYPIGTVGVSSLAAFVRDTKSDCFYHRVDDGTQCSGTLEITKLSISEKVVAGTFSYTISKPGCKTLTVTDGRFDLPLY